ncbi:MAG: hypothetical protein SF066_07735 [Thermoanaerobaculia bacterium]|nr:hypothetical protein [Thermoanaerobaculia bacterium]
MIRRRSSVILILFGVLALGSTVAAAQTPSGNPACLVAVDVALMLEPTASTPVQREQVPAPTGKAVDPFFIGDMSLIPEECVGCTGYECCICICATSPDPSCWIKCG